MGLYKNLLKPLLFRMPPEKAHYLGMQALKCGGQVPGFLKSQFCLSNESLKVKLWGLDFANPVGLAAGFDKNGEAVSYWQHLGFGFCEIGTVTARAQPGNPKPRIFRLPEDRALINRLGFNNRGADQVAAHLEQVFSRGQNPKIPLGINIGKSKVTPINEAAGDYRYSFEKLYRYADYITVNVSSPNTPGLRDLQDEESLKKILGLLLETGAKLSQAGKTKPLMVKLAPDLSNEALKKLFRLFLEIGVSGVILGNTTLSRENLQNNHRNEKGGLSGKPLKARALEMIQLAKENLDDDLAIIGCGGITSPEDARDALDAGAKLIQVYTALIYEGPQLVRNILQKLID